MKSRLLRRLLWALFGLLIVSFLGAIAALAVRMNIFDAGDAWVDLQYRPIIWQDDGEFHNAIRGADKFTILAQGHEDGDQGGDVIWTTSDPDEIEKIFRSIQFTEDRGRLDHCMCYGYPVLEWHKNGKRLVHVSVQHGDALRWEKFRAGYHFPGRSFIGDASLNETSAALISKILVDRGVEPYLLGLAPQPSQKQDAQQGASSNP